ncbi:MAG: SRPBCC domain-containing protein [Bacteroidota bacterium]
MKVRVSGILSTLLLIFTTGTVQYCAAQKSMQDEQSEIVSRVDSTTAGELILTQEVVIHASLEEVWDAYTTEAGWAKWSAPLVSIDLRAGGIIRTNYNAEGTLDDETTNTLFIRNYVPYQLITLQADIAPNWPEFMKSDADNLYNVVLFESLGENKTRLVSHGMGYQNNEKYWDLMAFFIKGNEMSYQKLKEVLE